MLQIVRLNLLLKYGEHPLERVKTRSPVCNDMAEMRVPATVATLAHHLEQLTCGERGKLLQCLANKRPIGIDQRGTYCADTLQTSPIEEVLDRATMDSEVAGNSAGPPFLDV